MRSSPSSVTGFLSGIRWSLTPEDANYSRDSIQKVPQNIFSCVPYSSVKFLEWCLDPVCREQMQKTRGPAFDDILLQVPQRQTYAFRMEERIQGPILW